MKPAIAFIIFFTGSIAWAGPTRKTFSNSCDAVWTAEQTALASYKNVVIDKDKRTAAFTETSTVNLTTSLSGSGDSCTVTVEGGLLRTYHKNSENFLNRVGNVLANSK